MTVCRVQFLHFGKRKATQRRDFRSTSVASPPDCDFFHLKMGERCDVEPTIDEFRSPRRRVVTGGQR